MSQLSEMKTQFDAGSLLWLTTFITEDGECYTFRSETIIQAQSRSKWIVRAWDAPFIISEDQE